MKIDEIDKKILEILQTNGRITNAKLAATIGISPPAMLERVRRLESAGVISQYAAVLDREKVGLEVMAIVSISLAAHELESIDRFRERLLALDEVLECHQVSGEDDFILKVVLGDIKSYSEFAMKKLAAIPGIQNFKSSIVLSTIKNSYSLPVKLQDA
ncbi:AsnC family transcriptional regulator [Desulfosarcina ovata subsp. sediminis]|uniref:AsnC family transcriptional regulator n=1 Tax=Desulfosarcina ovata subsp. sediminis TaxID=885957 RepID=A0A5K7ZVD9_9BACT|nr:Lrp/AsnC family transcriptional regulator [Desulfosarcina ovata]BBO84215.1 AsnC family transcriptional regulator [Desulfosarcina ovata subsp. sediminis]